LVVIKCLKNILQTGKNMACDDIWLCVCVWVHEISHCYWINCVCCFIST